MLRPRIAAALLLSVACDDPGTVSIEPLSPSTLDDLVATVHHDGPEDVEWTYSWSRDGELVPDATGPIVSADRTARDEVWTVSATRTQGPPEALLASVVVVNTPPTLGDASLSATEVVEGESLTVAVAGSDVDKDPLSPIISWTINGRVLSDADTTLTSDRFDRGDVVGVTVAMSDGDLQSAARDLGTVKVLNTPPTLDDVIVVPFEGAREGTTLSCEPGAARDADGDRLTFTRTWWVQDLPVATSPTLDGTWFDKGDRVRCEMIPTDGTEDGAVVASADVTILNTAPAVAGVLLSDLEPTVTSALMAQVFGIADDDGDVVSATLTWRADGEVIWTGSQANLGGVELRKGQELTVEAVVNDGSKSSEPVVSAVAVVQNSAPTVAAATIRPAVLRTADEATCLPLGVADTDGDDVNVTTSWTVNGSAAGTGPTLPASAFRKGDAVACTVTPSDGEADGLSASSPASTVANTPPTLASAVLTPSIATTATALSCTPIGWADADGDSPSHRFTWTIDGRATSFTSSTLPASAHAKGDAIQCTVAPDDGEAIGPSRSSAPVTITNTPPTAPVVAISPSQPEHDDDLVCTVTTDSTDADGDDVDYLVTWEVDGSTWTGAVTDGTLDGDTVDAEDTVVGDEWTCIATPYDGEEDGPSDSDTVEVELPSECTERTRLGTRYLFCELAVTYAEATALCEAFGSAIAVADTSADNQWIASTAGALGIDDAGGNTLIWHSLTDVVSEGDFRWPDGSRPTYTSWYFNQPDGGNSQDCTTVSVTSFRGVGKWFDAPCSGKEEFVCEG